MKGIIRKITLELMVLFVVIQAQANVTVHVLEEGLKLRQQDPVPSHPFLFQPQTATVQLYAAKNEAVAFQIILKSPAHFEEQYTFTATNLTGKDGRIAAANLEFFREWYLEVTEPSTAMYGAPSSQGAGWYPDPLLPLEAEKNLQEMALDQPQDYRSIWVDLYVPRETPAGTYRGQIKISSDQELIQNLKLDLTVWNFTLPDTTHLPTFFYFGPEQLRLAHQILRHSPACTALYHEYMQMAHGHRINLVTDVGVEDNWNYFDTTWGPYLDGTAFTSGIGQGVGCSLWPINLDIYGSQSQFQEQAVKVMEHFMARGWFDKPFLYVIDEPDEARYPEVRKIGAWLDDTPYPGNLLPFMLTEHLSAELTGFVDIWNSPRIKSAEMAPRQSAGDIFWTYNGGEPGAGSQCIDTDGWALRSWPWIAWKGQRRVWHYWDCCYFNDRVNRRGEIDVWKNPLTYDQRPKGDVDWGNGDGTLFYPGQQVAFGRNLVPGPVSSFRMKALRRGLQDYEYLWLARQRGKSRPAEEIINRVLPYPVLGDARPGKTCYVKSAEIWHAARLALAQLILETPGKSK